MQASRFQGVAPTLAASYCHHSVSSAEQGRKTRPPQGASHGMAGEPKQLPFDEGVKRRQRLEGECREGEAQIAGRRGGVDDLLQRPGLDAIERRQTGMDSE